MWVRHVAMNLPRKHGFRYIPDAGSPLQAEPKSPAAHATAHQGRSQNLVLACTLQRKAKRGTLIRLAANTGRPAVSLDEAARDC